MNNKAVCYPETSKSSRGEEHMNKESVLKENKDELENRITYRKSDYYFVLNRTSLYTNERLTQMLLFLADVIVKIGNCQADVFRKKMNDAIRYFPGNTALSSKTFDNWRTDIASFFGLYYEDYDHFVHVCSLAQELAKSGDIEQFFRQFLFRFQFPEGHQSTRTIRKQIENGIHFRPAQYILRVLLAGDSSEGKRIYITQKEAGYCIFNDLRCTRDNENPATVWARIKQNRENSVIYDKSREINCASNILKYMQLANLLVSDDGQKYYVNYDEADAFDAFLGNTEWFQGYEPMIKQCSTSSVAIRNCRDEWFQYLNLKPANVTFTAYEQRSWPENTGRKKEIQNLTKTIDNLTKILLMLKTQEEENQPWRQ